MNLRTLVNALFPAKCSACGINTENKTACRKCLATIAINKTLFCGSCDARLANNRKVCHKNFPYVLGAATNYDNKVIKNLVRDLKFKYIKGAAEPLGELLAEYAKIIGVISKNFIVMPVPLSTKRIRERGFNQSELIAKKFAGCVSLPMESETLTRIKNSKPQSGTKGISGRRENVRNCFSVTQSKIITGKNVILVDDVITSGATMLEATKTLKLAGAKKVVAMVVTRA